MDGGLINIRTGGTQSPLHSSGRLDLSTAEANGQSGIVTMKSGTARGGNSGGVVISTASSTAGKAGLISLAVGLGDSGDGGPVTISAGHTNDATAEIGSGGGEVRLIAGNSKAFNGGQIVIEAGVGESTSSGSLHFSSPDSGNAGRSGNVTFRTACLN